MTTWGKAGPDAWWVGLITTPTADTRIFNPILLIIVVDFWGSRVPRRFPALIWPEGVSCPNEIKTLLSLAVFQEHNLFDATDDKCKYALYDYEFDWYKLRFDREFQRGYLGQSTSLVIFFKCLHDLAVYN